MDGNVHTNGMENFWSLLKRGINGTYVSVEPFHLFRYVDEQAFRFNNRKDADGEPMNDAQRFSLAVSQITGKRLTYAELIGTGSQEANQLTAGPGEAEGLTLRFGPRLRGFASACFLYSASRRRISAFGTDMMRSTDLVKVSYSAECFTMFMMIHQGQIPQRK